ncbi:hypothetical protein PtrM4_073200 [Pyrenophora tritici-repentis]|uniref:HAT C-terminal dimerisation domain-containing protein n=1 Tax=Pyrenophora tritici-repentis TaxID=45151 RepID=A0A834S4F5_9PLEO|nr:hypothetical protein PtrM4_073200 [Pyrenophora tritici-repentis]
MTIPASSSDCERLFSELGDLLEPKRRALGSELLAALQLVRSWVRAGYKPYNCSEAKLSDEQLGPFHIWRPETAQEKREAADKIAEMNEALEPLMREEWELITGVRRLGLRTKPGKTPQWRWSRETGKLARGSAHGGIDWWRYQSQILIPKLIPFAKECQKQRPSTLVQEDKAPSHAHYAQRFVYQKESVEKLIWCGNSPDLNAIEPAWSWLKRRTTRRGAPKSRAEGAKAWEQAWLELPQHQIQAWIERIPVHVQKIIELNGGNEYKEGRD